VKLLVLVCVVLLAQSGVATADVAALERGPIQKLPALPAPVFPAVERATSNAGAAAEGTVWATLEALARLSESDYVAWMSDDFRFESDDPEFRAAFPHGMSRADERTFAHHLLGGLESSSDGRHLPHASMINVLAGPMVVTDGPATDGAVRVVLEHFHVHVFFADGSNMDLGDSPSVFDVVLTEAGWRIRRWTERGASGEPDEALADDTSPQPQSDSAASAPLRLSITARADRPRNALVFDLTLPSAGGAIDLFDVMGRRVTRRDLGGVGAGRRSLTLDGGAYPAGVYWARVRQGASQATARLVWVR